MMDEPRFPNGMGQRVDEIARRVSRNEDYRDEMRNDIAAIKTEIAVIHAEFEAFRHEYAEGTKATNGRLTSIAVGLRWAGTTFIALFGVVVTLFIRGG